MNIIVSIKKRLPKDPKIQGMIYFMVVIILTHVLWKLLVVGNEYGHEISIAGKDVTSFFYKISLFTAKISWWTMHHLFGQDFSLDGVKIYISNTYSISIIWACSAVKQIYMFICLIAFYPNVSWKKKFLFGLFGCILLEVFNIIRIDTVAIGTKYDEANFEVLHKYTQYLFYVVMFFIWIFWLEKTNSKNV